EPTANLDPEGVIEVRDSVERMLQVQRSTLIVVEHRLDVWLPLIDRVIVIGEGGVIADGPPDRVLKTEGARLAQAGVWVPGHPPKHPAAPASAPGETLVSALGLAAARVRGTTVAEDIDVDVRAGSVLAITGPNGVGKSTLGLTLAGLLPPAAGRVTASDGLSAGAGPHPIRWSSRQLLTRIGTVFQEPEHQLLARTVQEELEIGPRSLGLPDAE